MTTPLLPDDYIGLLNPAWSTRELTGVIAEVRPETKDASTIVVRPNFPWPGHTPGQYLRIGVEIDGKRHWRAYSLTSDPDHPDGFVSITVKHVKEGQMSPYFTREAKPGSTVFLGEVEGQFTLPDPLPEKMFFISAGSGITPIMAMLRDLHRRGEMRDVVHLHCHRERDDFIFEDMLRGLEDHHDGYSIIANVSKEQGRITPEKLDDICPDWRDRIGFLSGPGDMIDSITERWESEADRETLHVEHFQPVIGTGDGSEGEGGTVFFRVTDLEATCESGVSILVGGEEAGGTLPFGCRMGICHTCVGRLREGTVRDLRTGETENADGQMVRTCVNAPEGHVEIEL